MSYERGLIARMRLSQWEGGKILDPACGSGHFLLYCFDLLLTIYEEAWADEQSPASEGAGKSLRDDYPSLEALRRELPGLVLRHNLWGGHQPVKPDTIIYVPQTVGQPK